MELALEEAWAEQRHLAELIDKEPPEVASHGYVEDIKKSVEQVRLRLLEAQRKLRR